MRLFHHLVILFAAIVIGALLHHRYLLEKKALQVKTVQEKLNISDDELDELLSLVDEEPDILNDPAFFASIYEDTTPHINEYTSHILKEGDFDGLVHLPTLYGASRDLGTDEARKLYHHLIHDASYDDIPLDMDQSCLTRAAIEFAHRRAVRRYIRERGPYYAEKLVQLVDLLRYGDVDGPDFQTVLGKYGSRADTLEEVCHHLRDASHRTNPLVDQWMAS